jgi:hypothetical protein
MTSALSETRSRKLRLPWSRNVPSNVRESKGHCFSIRTRTRGMGCSENSRNASSTSTRYGRCEFSTYLLSGLSCSRRRLHIAITFFLCAHHGGANRHHMASTQLQCASDECFMLKACQIGRTHMKDGGVMGSELVR